MCRCKCAWCWKGTCLRMVHVYRYSSQHQEGLHLYVDNERSEQLNRRSSAQSVMLCCVNWVESVLK